MDFGWLEACLFGVSVSYSEKNPKKFPSIYYDLECDMNAIYKLETQNHNNSTMTWTQHTYKARVGAD